MLFQDTGGFAIEWFTIDAGGGTSTDGQPEGFDVSGTVQHPEHHGLPPEKGMKYGVGRDEEDLT